MTTSERNSSVLPGIGPSVLLMILLSSWLTLVYVHQRMPQDEAIRIDSGLRLIDSKQLPPEVSNPDWQGVQLTDDWWSSAPHERQIWYRFNLDLDVAPNRLWAIYLPRAAVNASVWLNGEIIGSGGRLYNPTTINWSRPLYLLIPNGLLRPGNNEIFIQLVSDLEGNGLLRPFYLGIDAELATYYNWRYFLDVTAVEIITVFMFVIGIFMGALWWMRRDPVYGWFSLMVFVWAMHHFALLVTYPPVSAALWWWFWYMTIGWAIIGTVFFTHTVLELKKPRLERLILAIGISGSIILAVAAANGGYWLRLAGNHGWDSMVLIVGCYSIYRIYTGWRFEQQRDIRWLLTSGLLTFTFGARDWLVLNSFLPRDEGFYIQYSPPLVLAIFGWILLTRFVGALNTAEQLNLDLEQRVAQRVDEVERQHHQIRYLENQQLLANERERLMRDMHDGIGGHLISTLAMVESPQADIDEIQLALHAALDDLRLVVNSLDPDLDDLATALGDLHYRLGPRLQAAGIEVDWQTRDLPDIQQLGPGRVLQILRIVQEAITNVIKHSGCNRLQLDARVSTDESQSHLLLKLEDNGHGIRKDQRNGKGIGNMKKRARQIGGQLLIESGSSSTRVDFQLPLEAAKKVQTEE